MTEEMEESFELLSSMSPKVKHCQKQFRKGTTVLALRKSLRRSSIFDKSIKTEKNDEIIVTEISSTATTESNSSKSTKTHNKLLNTTTISIHDSDSEHKFKLTSNKSKPLEEVEKTSVHKVQSNSLLSKDKFEHIKHWVDNVNLQSELKDSTTLSAYSELSTIYGEENGRNFISEKTGRAVNSTVIGSKSIHFDDFFKQKTDYVRFSSSEDKDIEGKLVIDESYTKQDGSVTKSIRQNGSDSVRSTEFTIDASDLISNSERSVISSSTTGKNQQKSSNNVYKKNDCEDTEKSKSDDDIVNDSDNSFSLNESLNTRLKNKVIDAGKRKILSNCIGGSGNNLESNSKNSLTTGGNTSENELASMLDDLYGNKWREKEEHVLFRTPKTEPKKQMPKLNDHCTNSERKPKLSVLYKNPYLETEKSKSYNLLQTLHKSRLKKNNMESPAIKRLNNVCDSDTDSDTQTKPRTRLNFDDSDCDIETTSKYFKDTNPNKKETESDKENLNDFSFLGQSLEERIRKKIHGVKDISGGKTKAKKNSGDKATLTKKSDSNKMSRNVDFSTKKQEEKTDHRKLSRPSNSSSDESWEEEISKIVHESKLVNGKYSFLASLSANIPILQCDMSARIYRNNFKHYKDQLLTKLFKLYNEKVFENAIPHDTVLEWNDRMRGTAGFCYCRKITRRTGAVERTARIVLSTKVIDAAYRLRDTLVHEMCHAATWIVNCVSDGHGPFWKSWACKAMKTFPELPPIKRCHDYVITTKYTYKCTQCGYSIGRHSKSLDIERKRCGYCLGKFEVLLNKVSKKGETKSVPATPKREATGFALFVKENYGVYKQTHLKHGDVMRLLGQKFQEMKLKPS